jgi:hypothetical protein
MRHLIAGSATADESEVERDQELREVHNGSYGAEFGCLNETGPENRNGNVGTIQIKLTAGADEERARQELAELATPRSRASPRRRAEWP